MRILSVVPNSAATERIFSKMGTVRSKLRSRLHPGKVRKTVLVAEHNGQQWPRPIHASRKRKFGGDTGSASVMDESGRSLNWDRYLHTHRRFPSAGPLKMSRLAGSKVHSRVVRARDTKGGMC